MTTDTIQDDCIDSDQSILIVATRVPGDQRMQFMPRFFGREMRLAEALVYSWMHELAPEYQGGFWNFYELSNGGCYMAPELDCETVQICCAGNFYTGRMSPDAAGIVASLHALNVLSWMTRRSRMLELFDLLRDYTGDHAEGPEIFAAID